jgi:CheY-like chemotaxis protein
MPVMDGLEFLQRLRAEFGPGTPPVVFCTTETGAVNACGTRVSR